MKISADKIKKMVCTQTCKEREEKRERDMAIMFELNQQPDETRRTIYHVGETVKDYVSFQKINRIKNKK